MPIWGEKKIISCKDFLISDENFEVSQHKPGVLKTTPVPKNLMQYYQSEDYISHTDSSVTFQDKLYNSVRRYMLSKKVNWITDIKKEGGNILDYGCGTGEFLLQMQSKGWKTYGLEPNEKARKLATEKNLQVTDSLENIEDSKFDVISLWHVLEHVPNYEDVLIKLKKALKPNGILIIAVPNYNADDAKYYREFWAAWDVPRHLWHFSRKGLKKELLNTGFNFVQEQPLIFDSYYVSLLSEKNQKSSNLVNAFFRGLLSNLKAYSTREFSSIAYFFQNT